MGSKPHSNADTVIVGTDFGPGSLTDSGYPRIAKRWKRGEPLAEAETLCELVARERVDQVQARSLAIDPDQYLAVASQHSAGGPRIGLRELLRRLRKARRGLVIGNFARGLNERRV